MNCKKLFSKLLANSLLVSVSIFSFGVITFAMEKNQSEKLHYLIDKETNEEKLELRSRTEKITISITKNMKTIKEIMTKTVSSFINKKRQYGETLEDFASRLPGCVNGGNNSSEIKIEDLQNYIIKQLSQKFDMKSEESRSKFVLMIWYVQKRLPEDLLSIVRGILENPSNSSNSSNSSNDSESINEIDETTSCCDSCESCLENFRDYLLGFIYGCCEFCDCDE